MAGEVLEPTFSTKEVAELADVPIRTLQWWVQQGLLRPHTYGGRGVDTRWSNKDVREARVLAKLRGFFSIRRLKDVLTYLRGLGFNPMSTGQFLVVVGTDGTGRDLLKPDVVDGQERAISLARERMGQGVLVLDLDA